MNAKTIFVDTCVFMHFKMFTDIDWRNICQSKEVLIIVPVVTSKELDEKKDTDPNTILRERCQNVIKKLEGFMSHSCPASVRSGVTLDFDNTVPSSDHFKKLGVDPAWRDDRLIATVLGYAERHPESSVAIVTSDFGLRLRASAYELEVIPMPEDSDLKLPAAADLSQKELRKAREKLAALEVQIPELHVVFKGNANFVELGALRPLTPESSDLEDCMEQLREQYPMFQLESPKPVQNTNINPLMEMSRQVQSMLRQMNVLHQPPPEKMKEYNEQLELFYRNYIDYLLGEFSEENVRRRTFRLELILENQGKVPADDIYVDLYPKDIDHVRLCDELPDSEGAPEAPSRPRSALEGIWNPPTVFLPGAGGLCPPTIMSSAMLNPNVSGPSIGEAEALTVSYYVKRLIHNFKEPLSSFYIVFDSYDDISGFPIEYEIRSANVPDVQTGRLNVNIKK